jgi:predicted ATPase/DNA-binding winged helix-turn-helix (wHTH) protein
MGDADAAQRPSAQVRFGDVVMDTASMTLCRGGEPVHVEPQVFEVLVFLYQNRHRVVAKTELLDSVWGNRFVSESALTSRIRSARAAVGDSGDRQWSIRTVHGRGYQFVAQVDPDVEAQRPTDSPAESADSPRATDPAEPAGRDGAQAFPPPRRLLVDRHELMPQIEATVADNHLVTLVGPAGVGKTLLAHHVAYRLSGNYSDGAWFVPLADTRLDRDVGAHIIDTIGATRFPATSSDQTLVSLLAGRRALLVLDNCEHVLREVAELVGRLVFPGGPMTVVATSRQRLGLPGEMVIAVPVLDRRHGVALFRERAAEQGLQLPADTGVVDDLCQALDQLPLALELATAQARVLGVEQLVGLLDRRLHLLAATSFHDGAHRTLEGAIETSYTALSAEQQETLGRFSQFAGWFDLDAARAVAADDRDLDAMAAVQHVVALAECSLLEVDTSRQVTRYRLLESIRLYAAERLGDLEAARRAHVRCFHARAADRGYRLAGPDFERAFLELRRDWTNYRAAVRYATDLGMLTAGLDIVNATIDFAEITLSFEHDEWAETLLDATIEEDSPAALAARAGRARLLCYERRLDEQAVLARRCGDPEQSYSAALAHFWREGAYGEMEPLAVSFALLERHTAGTGGIRELTVGAISHLAASNPEIDPTAASARALAVSARSGDVGRAFGQVIEANLALRSGQIEQTLDACDRSLDLASSLGLEVVVAQVHALRVRAVRSHPDLTLVARCVSAAFSHYRSRGHWASARNDAAVAARVAAEAGLGQEAADILDGYRPVRYRSVPPEYVAALRRQLVSTVGPGLEGLLRTGVTQDPEQYCDFVLATIERAASRLGGPAGP